MVDFIFEHPFYFYLIGVVINFVIGFFYKFITKDFNTSWEDVFRSITIYIWSYLSLILVLILLFIDFIKDVNIKIKPPKYL